MTRFIPEGSYQKTSQNIYVNLYCDAQKVDQSWTTASYPICVLNEPNAGLVNWNGSLAPEEGSYPAKGFIPSGSYATTCKNIKVILTAECQKRDGRWQFSTLDITDYCEQGDIANMDGVLVRTADWMRDKVADNVLLRTVSMPGTHDTGTCNIDIKKYPSLSWAKDQDIDIENQLLMGIRALDIRCAPSLNEGCWIFNINHADVFCNLTFDNVLKMCTDFLSEHKDEVIVMFIKKEIDVQGAPPFETIFNSYVTKYGSDRFWLNNSVPTVGEVRGKIVITHRDEELTCGIRINWQDNKTFCSKDLVSFCIQDYYKPEPCDGAVDRKKEAIKDQFNAAIDAAKKGDDCWYVNFTSAFISGCLVGESFAKEINPYVHTYLSSEAREGRVGIVMMDFAGKYDSDETIVNIISRNHK